MLKKTSKTKILLVEDDRFIQKTNRYLLEESHYHVDIAVSAQEAVKYALSHKYFLILLDYGLPDMNGCEVCKIIRRQLYIRDIPIIILTASGIAIKQDCLDAGADDFILKPLTKEILNKLTKKWQLSVINNCGSLTETVGKARKGSKKDMIY